MQASSRLKTVMRLGNLTVADLARWFERPDPTVRGWVKGRRIGGPYGDVEDVRRRLEKLEKLIQTGKLPVPKLSGPTRRNFLRLLVG